MRKQQHQHQRQKEKSIFPKFDPRPQIFPQVGIETRWVGALVMAQKGTRV